MLQAESFQALIDSESEEEKQNEEAENNTYVTLKDTSESKDVKKNLKKRKVQLFITFAHIFFKLYTFY